MLDSSTLFLVTSSKFEGLTQTGLFLYRSKHQTSLLEVSSKITFESTIEKKGSHTESTTFEATYYFGHNFPYTGDQLQLAKKRPRQGFPK